MREFNPNGPVDLASGLQKKVNQDLESLRAYNQRANTVDCLLYTSPSPRDRG